MPLTHPICDAVLFWEAFLKWENLICFKWWNTSFSTLQATEAAHTTVSPDTFHKLNHRSPHHHNSTVKLYAYCIPNASCKKYNWPFSFRTLINVPVFCPMRDRPDQHFYTLFPFLICKTISFASRHLIFFFTPENILNIGCMQPEFGYLVKYLHILIK